MPITYIPRPGPQRQGTTRSIVAQVDDDRGVQSTQWGDEEILQGEEQDLCQHYGFASRPIPGTELIGDTRNSGGAVTIAERATPPQTLASGESITYDSKGNYNWNKNSNGIQTKALEGDVKIESVQENVDIRATAKDVDITGNVNVDIVATTVDINVSAYRTVNVNGDHQDINLTAKQRIVLLADGLRTYAVGTTADIATSKQVVLDNDLVYPNALFLQLINAIEVLTGIYPTGKPWTLTDPIGWVNASSTKLNAV